MATVTILVLPGALDERGRPHVFQNHQLPAYALTRDNPPKYLSYLRGYGTILTSETDAVVMDGLTADLTILDVTMGACNVG